MKLHYDVLPIDREERQIDTMVLFLPLLMYDFDITDVILFSYFVYCEATSFMVEDYVKEEQARIYHNAKGMYFGWIQRTASDIYRELNLKNRISKAKIKKSLDTLKKSGIMKVVDVSKIAGAVWRGYYLCRVDFKSVKSRFGDREFVLLCKAYDTLSNIRFGEVIRMNQFFERRRRWLGIKGK